jgi:hypothetical protein
MRHRPHHARRAPRHAARLLAALLSCLAIAPSAAHATALLSGTATLPGSVDEGATGLPATLTLVNASSAPDGAITVCNAGEGGVCASSTGITLLPSCGALAAFPRCATPDPGVFRISPTARGEQGTSCSGLLFSVSAADATYGSVRFTPAGGAHVVLPEGFFSVCRIEFTFDVVKMPLVDAKPDVDGVQTIPIVEALGRSDAGNPALASDPAAAITVVPAPPPPPEPPADPALAPAGNQDPAAGGAGGLASPGCPAFLFAPIGSGGHGDDRLTGGKGIDIIHGLAGADVVRGGAGRDCLYGDGGADVLQGGAGGDYLFGGAGRDRLVGQAGGDRIDGEAGNDHLVGGPGADRLSGGGGADLVDARDPTARDRRLVDHITCGAGRDVVRADAGDDVAADCERVQRRR